MSPRVRVAMETLTRKSESLDRLALSYKTQYGRLYKQVEALELGWRGVDNREFTLKIEAMRSDFEAMAKLLEDGAKFLRYAEREYASVQDRADRKSAGIW